jgi:ferrous iron transport protein B
MDKKTAGASPVGTPETSNIVQTDDAAGTLHVSGTPEPADRHNTNGHTDSRLDAGTPRSGHGTCCEEGSHAGHGGHHHRRGLAALVPQRHHNSGGQMSGMAPMPDSSSQHPHPSPRIVFVGNPNVGKSTLFNAVLGANATVMNAPGTTVLVESGSLERDGRRWDFIDTPGTASLDAYSPDEQVAAEAALGLNGNERPDLIVFTFNAASPSKSYYLLSQLMDCGLPIVIAVTMLDLAEKRHSPATLQQLRRTLPGIPMVGVDGRTGKGKNELLDTIATALTETKSRQAGQPAQIDGAPTATRKPQQSTNTALNKASRKAEAALTAMNAASGPLDEGGADVSREIRVKLTPARVTSTPLPGPNATQDEVSRWVRDSADERFDWIATKLHEIDDCSDQSAANTTISASPETFSDKLDRVLLHPVVGIAVFLITMFLVFEATTTLAGPLQDWFDVTLRGWCTSGIAWLFTSIGGKAALDGWLYSLVVDGLLNGAITVCTFIPPMGIMFVILSLLEDSGYLARAAFVMDRAMRMVGLDGRAFLPLVVGFGCNLPALASTRTLPDSRQRLLTGLLIPFTSCSARLSVYVVLAYAFFGKYAGLAIFLMYVSSIAIILIVGFALRKTQFKDLKTQPFAMELPPYQMPHLLQLLKSVLLRLWSFITGASSVIISMLIVVWVLSAVPVSAGAAGTNTFGHVDEVQNSAFGAAASAIAPVFKPAGFADWHASAALVTGFVAKEVVVGSLSQSYAINNADDQAEQVQGQGSLGQAVHQSFEKSSDGHPSAAAAAFMIFILAYTPCLATVAEMKRQYGMKTALQSVGMGLVVAYILAILVFQIGRLL